VFEYLEHDLAGQFELYRGVHKLVDVVGQQPQIAFVVEGEAPRPDHALVLRDHFRRAELRVDVPPADSVERRKRVEQIPFVVDDQSVALPLLLSHHLDRPPPVAALDQLLVLQHFGLDRVEIHPGQGRVKQHLVSGLGVRRRKRDPVQRRQSLERQVAHDEGGGVLLVEHRPVAQLPGAVLPPRVHDQAGVEHAVVGDVSEAVVGVVDDDVFEVAAVGGADVFGEDVRQDLFTVVVQVEEDQLRGASGVVVGAEAVQHPHDPVLVDFHVLDALQAGAVFGAHVRLPSGVGFHEGVDLGTGLQGDPPECHRYSFADLGERHVEVLPVVLDPRYGDVFRHVVPPVDGLLVRGVAGPGEINVLPLVLDAEDFAAGSTEYRCWGGRLILDETVAEEQVAEVVAQRVHRLVTKAKALELEVFASTCIYNVGRII
jgi:hypothetical protein